MARPKKEPHERRSAALPPVRVTDAEHAQLSLQAERAGLTLTAYLRQRVMGGTVTAKRGLADAQLLSELNRIGVNLNQIARSLNRGQDHDPHQLGYILGHLVQVLEQVDRKTGGSGSGP